MTENTMDMITWLDNYIERVDCAPRGHNPH